MTKHEVGDKTIILFDGNCNFCTKWVLYLARIDRHDRFRFSAVSMEAAQPLIEKYNLQEIKNESVIVIRKEQVYIKTDAVLIIIHALGGLWTLLDVWTVFPHSWMDAVYDWFAARRYKWFGRKNSCYIPEEKDRNKFLG